jgi:hypothetical protein
MNVTDPKVPFARVKDTLREADVLFGNLECCFYCRATHEVRVRRQPQNREGARPHDPAAAAATGGSSDQAGHDLPTTNSGVFIRCTDPNKITATNAYEVNIFDQRPRDSA